jgi:hypothetical protein
VSHTLFDQLRTLNLPVGDYAVFGSSADTMKKIIWVVIVAIFPLLGLIVWFFIGPGSPKK